MPSSSAHLAEYVGRRRYFRLWSKVRLRPLTAYSCARPFARRRLTSTFRHPQYNYIISVGLDTGTIIGILIVFLCLQLPKDGTLALNWWGNLVWQESQSRHPASLPLLLLAERLLFAADRLWYPRYLLALIAQHLTALGQLCWRPQKPALGPRP
jgi:hypothetical protein